LAVHYRKPLSAARWGLSSKSLYHKDFCVSDVPAFKARRVWRRHCAYYHRNPEETVAMPENTSDQMFGMGAEPRLGRSVSLDHAAEILGVSRRTIYNRIREGRLVTIRTLGGSQRVLLDSVQLSKES